MSKVQYLIDAEPYQKGDVVDVPEDRVGYLVDQKIVKKVDQETPIFVKGVTPEPKEGAMTPEEKEVAQTEAASGRKAARTKPGESAPVGEASGKTKKGDK